MNRLVLVCLHIRSPTFHQTGPRMPVTSFNLQMGEPPGEKVCVIRVVVRESRPNQPLANSGVVASCSFQGIDTTARSGRPRIRGLSLKPIIRREASVRFSAGM